MTIIVYVTITNAVIALPITVLVWELFKKLF